MQSSYGKSRARVLVGMDIDVVSLRAESDIIIIFSDLIAVQSSYGKSRACVLVGMDIDIVALIVESDIVIFSDSLSVVSSMHVHCFHPITRRLA